jgi:hypothetical protein
MDEIDSAIDPESTARVGFNRRLDIGFELDELQIKSNSAAKPGPISNVGFNRRWHRAREFRQFAGTPTEDRGW